MKALLLALLISTTASAQNSESFHRRLDRCYNNELLCVGHVLIDAIFYAKNDPGQGSDYFSVEFFEGFDGRDCSSYSIVRTNLQHNKQQDNLRVCENLAFQYGSKRTVACVKVDGKSQQIRPTYVGTACNDLAFQ